MEELEEGAKMEKLNKFENREKTNELINNDSRWLLSIAKTVEKRMEKGSKFHLNINFDGHHTYSARYKAGWIDSSGKALFSIHWAEQYLVKIDLLIIWIHNTRWVIRTCDLDKFSIVYSNSQVTLYEADSVYNGKPIAAKSFIDPLSYIRHVTFTADDVEEPYAFALDSKEIQKIINTSHSKFGRDTSRKVWTCFVDIKTHKVYTDDKFSIKQAVNDLEKSGHTIYNKTNPAWNKLFQRRAELAANLNKKTTKPLKEDGLSKKGDEYIFLLPMNVFKSREEAESFSIILTERITISKLNIVNNKKDKLTQNINNNIYSELTNLNKLIVPPSPNGSGEDPSVKINKKIEIWKDSAQFGPAQLETITYPEAEKRFKLSETEMEALEAGQEVITHEDKTYYYYIKRKII
jgi:hypothetical protein